MNKILKIICEDLKTILPICSFIILWGFTFFITVMLCDLLFNMTESNLFIFSTTIAIFSTIITGWIGSIYYRLKKR